MEPESPEALAGGIARLYLDQGLRSSVAAAGSRDVEQFDVRRLAPLFLSEVEKVAPGMASGSRTCETNHDRISARVVLRGR